MALMALREVLLYQSALPVGSDNTYKTISTHFLEVQTMSHQISRLR